MNRETTETLDLTLEALREAKGAMRDQLAEIDAVRREWDGLRKAAEGMLDQIEDATDKQRQGSKELRELLDRVHTLIPGLDAFIKIGNMKLEDLEHA